VANQNGWALLQIQYAFGRCDVVGKRCQGLLHHADRVAVLAKNVGDAPPSGAVGEGPVDQDDVLDRLGPRRRDGRRQQRSRCGRYGNEFLGIGLSLVNYCVKDELTLKSGWQSEYRLARQRFTGRARFLGRALWSTLGRGRRPVCPAALLIETTTRSGWTATPHICISGGVPRKI